MENAIDELARLGPAVSLPEQTFFSDPVVDRVMGITMALAAEVYILRSRVRALERVQRRVGQTPCDTGELSGEELAAEQQDAAAFAAHLLEPAIGEQQARGPL